MEKNKKVIISLLTVVILSVLSFVFIATRYRNTASVSKNLNNTVSNDQINFFDPSNPPQIDFKKGMSLGSEYINDYGANGQTLSVDAKNYHDLQERILFKVGVVSHPLNVSLMGIKDDIALLFVAGEQHPDDLYAPTGTAYIVTMKTGVLDKVERLTATVVLDNEKVILIRDHDIFSYKLGAQKFIQVPHSNEIPENEVYQFSQGVIPDDSSLSFDGKNFTIRRCVLSKKITEKEVCTLQTLEFPN